MGTAVRPTPPIGPAGRRAVAADRVQLPGVPRAGAGVPAVTRGPDVGDEPPVRPAGAVPVGEREGLGEQGVRERVTPGPEPGHDAVRPAPEGGRPRSGRRGPARYRRACRPGSRRVVAAGVAATGDGPGVRCARRARDGGCGSRAVLPGRPVRRRLYGVGLRGVGRCAVGRCGMRWRRVSRCRVSRCGAWRCGVCRCGVCRRRVCGRSGSSAVVARIAAGQRVRRGRLLGHEARAQPVQRAAQDARHVHLGTAHPLRDLRLREVAVVAQDHGFPLPRRQLRQQRAHARHVVDVAVRVPGVGQRGP